MRKKYLFLSLLLLIGLFLFSTLRRGEWSGIRGEGLQELSITFDKSLTPHITAAMFTCMEQGSQSKLETLFFNEQTLKIIVALVSFSPLKTLIGNYLPSLTRV